MKKTLFKKGLVFGIILLFMGVSFISSVGKINIAKSNITVNDGSLLGFVNDTSGNPIEGALVRVHFHETYEEDYSDEDGYYHVINIPICYCLKNTTCFKDGYAIEWVLLGIAENTTQDFILIPGNNPPEAPDITGPVTSKPGITYDYTFKAIDPDGDAIRYFIDWDDGNTEWTEYCSSGEEIIISHTWIENRFHLIRARANDTHGALGPWGYLQVSREYKNEIISSSLFLRFLEHYPLLNRLLFLLVI